MSDPPGLPRAGAPSRANWTMIGVIVSILTLAAGVVWANASLDTRVAALEEQLEPGVIQRLDERTLQIQRSLDRLIEGRESGR